MTHRYALRFEEGERRGEIVALTGATTTFGRKPGNSVQVLDPSVSGKHAELLLDAQGVLLRDLGSTNGTRVNGERISERRLLTGDRVMFGTIDLVFMDAEAAPAARGEDDIGLDLEADAPAPARTTPRPEVEATAVVPSMRTLPTDTGEAVRSIGAEKLAKSRKKSAVAWVGLLVIAAGAGAAWWFTRGSGGGSQAAPPRSVTPVAGNLLAAGYSFEGADLPEGWTNAEGASSAFDPDRAARASGQQGLSADLSAGGTALLSSGSVAAGQPLELTAALAAEGGAEVRAGVRLESSAGHLPIEAWGPWVRASEGDTQEARSLAVAAPQAYDRARALVAARAGAEGGTVRVDDVALVPASGAKPRAVAREDVELVLLGEPPTAGVLFKIDRPLLSGIRATLPEGGEAPLAVEADPLGMRIATAGATLEFSAELDMAAGGIATTGSEGFKSHQAQFERAGVDGVLIGKGRELVRVRFEPPASVRGRPIAGERGATFSFQASGSQRALVQVTFNDDRVAGEALAREARTAERAGDPAKVIAEWTRLINEHPIDADLVAEAETGRAKALSGGLAAVAAVRADVDRARFFRLIEQFRECRARALALAAKYAGSEVEESARALAASLEQDIAVLAKDLDQLEARRLAQIHAVLVARKNTRLSTRVAAELKQRFGVDDPAALLESTKTAASATPAGGN